MKKHASALIDKYSKLYTHNPKGVLELHIDNKMKKGKTREEAIKKLQEEEVNCS